MKPNMFGMSPNIKHKGMPWVGNFRNVVYYSQAKQKISHTKDAKLGVRAQNYRSVIIQNVYHDPECPEYSDSATIYAEVYGADKVYLNYTYDNQYHYVEMTQIGNTYYYTLPPNQYGTTVVYRIQAYNYSESSSAHSEWYNFTYSDFTPPSIETIEKANNSLTLRPVKFRVNVTEDMNASGVYGAYIILQYSPDNRTWGDPVSYMLSYNSTSKLWEIEISFVDYGYYRYYFVAEDHAGNIAYLPDSGYYYLIIYPRYAEIIGNNITVSYSDSVIVRVQLVDLNDSRPIKYAYIDVYLNKTSGLEYLTTIQTNGTGYTWFTLHASWSVGQYGLVFIFEDPSYKRLEKTFVLEIVPESVVFDVDADTNTYNATIEIDIVDDDGDSIEYGSVRIESGSILFDKRLNDLMDITVIVDIFDAINFFSNGSWWLALNITFYGNPNYKNTTERYIIPISATIIEASYNSSIKQGEYIHIIVNITDKDGLINYTIKLDETILRNELAYSSEIRLDIEHKISISTEIGQHAIIVEVVDAKGGRVSRTFIFYVEATKIILYAEFIVTGGALKINGTTKYECDWSPENISIKIIIQQGEEIKIYKVENRTIRNNTIFWCITINIEGEIIAKILALDPYGHTAEISKTLNIPPPGKEIPIWLPIIVAGILGASTYLFLMRKRE